MFRSVLARQGFTLIEIMVVVGLIGILVTAGAMSFGNSSAQGRDAQRQSDLRNLQQAIETYRNREGRYPEGCNGPNQWAGQLGTDYECTVTGAGTGQYIVGLAPEYIPVLPVDPKLPSGRTDVGYVYRTNVDGTVYKIMAMNTVEADESLRVDDPIAYLHPFKSCAVEARRNADGTASYLASGSICHKVYDSAGAQLPGSTPPNQCAFDDARFQHSYALWGGFDFVAGPNRDGKPPYTGSSDADWKGFWKMADVICK